MPYWFVDMTTRRNDGRLVLDRSPVMSEAQGVVRSVQLAELFFGNGNYTEAYNCMTRSVDFLGENIFDEAVCIELVSLDYVPLHQNGVTMQARAGK